MSANLFNLAPFLRTTREFPLEAQPLSVEINKAYVDTALFVNQRIIGLYPSNKPMVTGETWFITGPSTKQQSLRQVFSFGAIASTTTIPHEIPAGSISTISPKSYGVFTDGTNWYGIPFAASTSISGQVTFYVDATYIHIVVDAGAPTISSGLINLEWITQV